MMVALQLVCACESGAKSKMVIAASNASLSFMEISYAQANKLEIVLQELVLIVALIAIVHVVARITTIRVDVEQEPLRVVVGVDSVPVAVCTENDVERRPVHEPVRIEALIRSEPISIPEKLWVLATLKSVVTPYATEAERVGSTEAVRIEGVPLSVPRIVVRDDAPAAVVPVLVTAPVFISISAILITPIFITVFVLTAILVTAPVFIVPRLGLLFGLFLRFLLLRLGRYCDGECRQKDCDDKFLHGESPAS